MKDILTNPNSGYYMSRDVFGRLGDFITSPEIGQIFGELIAIWCLTEYNKIGSPESLQIIELGPGRGTMIQDILRVWTQFKSSDSFSLHLVEMSPYLSNLQARKLCYSSSEMDTSKVFPYYRMGETLTGVKIFWYRRIEDIPRNFSIILAHEFFDALPIHKLVKQENVWKEVLIDIDPANKDKFRFVISRNETPMSKLFTALHPHETRDHIEISPESDLLAKHIAERLEMHGGFGLIMDYGHLGEKQDTFRVSAINRLTILILTFFHCFSHSRITNSTIH
jgi:NADH dehydrogenase [ubiquinone] 1 alpha subcomplex assembly factor 7